MLKKIRTSAKAGTPTIEGTPATVETPGTEEMSTTAGPKQQQKRNQQHES
jgi:hypothetical protein